MPAFCVDKFNAFACSGRLRPRRSEPEVAPAGRRRAMHSSYIIHYFFHLTPPEPDPNPAPISGKTPPPDLKPGCPH